jgi:hypothetical protein
MHLKKQIRPKLVIAWGLSGGGGGLFGATMTSWGNIPLSWTLATLLVSGLMFVGSITIGLSHNRDIRVEEQS